MAVVTSSFRHGGGSQSYFWSGVWWGSFLLEAYGDGVLGRGSPARRQAPSFTCLGTEAAQILGGPGAAHLPSALRPAHLSQLRSHFERYAASANLWPWGNCSPFPVTCVPGVCSASGREPGSRDLSWWGHLPWLHLCHPLLA